MADEMLLDHVADIVSAHVSNNSVAAGDLPGLIQSVYASLASLGQVPEPTEEVRTPAVSVRASVKPDAVTCLDCGAKFKMLKHHLSTDHGMTPAEYRARWNLAAEDEARGHSCVDLAGHHVEELLRPRAGGEDDRRRPREVVRRKELALKIGLGRKPRQVAVVAPAKLKRTRKKLGVAFGSQGVVSGGVLDGS